LPKGRIGISGPGPFYRVRLPKDGHEPKTEEQRKLASVAAIKDEVLAVLEKRLPQDGDHVVLDDCWDAIIHAVGGYLGQAKNGPPPTEAERNKALSRIEQAAGKLEAEIAAANFHVTDFLHKAMHRRGADLFEFKKHLEAITDPMPMVEEVRQPKGRPDPYLEDLIRGLVKVWIDATGKAPGKTGTNHYEGGRTSPFYRWSNIIAKPAIGKSLPRDLVDTVIDLCKPDG
jgi:hypothetical protein